MPALEAALRDDENAGLRNAAMEIYVRLGARPRWRRSWPSSATVTRRSATSSGVMLGALRDPRAVEPLIAALRDPDVNVRHAAAASLGQIGAPEAVPRPRRGPAGRALDAVPGHPGPGRDRGPRAAAALLALLDDPLFRGPALEALGRAGRARRTPALRAPPLRPRARRCATRPSGPWWRSSSGPPPAGESLDPEVQEALRREDLVAHLLGMLSDDDPQNRRTAAITLGWLREERAESPPDRASRRRRPAGARHPRPRVHRLPRPGGLRARPRCIPRTRCARAPCAAWPGCAPAGDRSGRAPHPRSFAGGEGGGGGRHRPPGARGRGHAAVRASGRRKRADPGERHGRARPHAARARGAHPRPGPGQRRRGGARAGRRDAGPGARPGNRARSHRGSGAIRGRPCGRPPSSPWASWRCRASPLSCGGPRGSERAWCGNRPCSPSASAAEPDTAALLLPLLDEADPRLASPPCGPWARSAARRRRSGSFLPRRAQGAALRGGGGAGRDPCGGRGAPARRARCGTTDRNLRRAAAESLGRSPIPRPCRRSSSPSRTSTGACAAPPRPPSGGWAAPRRRPRCWPRLGDEDPTVRRAAVAALGEVGDARAAGALVGSPGRSRAPGHRPGGAAPPGRPRAARDGERLRRSRRRPEVRRLLVDLAGRLEDRGVVRAAARRPRRRLRVGARGGGARARARAASARPCGRSWT